MARDDQDERMGRVVPDEMSWYEMAVQEFRLAGHLLLPHEPTHPLNLLGLLFYIIKYFYVPNICVLTSGLQVTFKRTQLYSAFWRENSQNHFSCSMVLAAPLQQGAESTRAFGLFYLRDYHWSPMVAWLPLVPIGIIYFNRSVAFGHH